MYSNTDKLAIENVFFGHFDSRVLNYNIFSNAGLTLF
jgi:hypothetical protein